MPSKRTCVGTTWRSYASLHKQILYCSITILKECKFKWHQPRLADEDRNLGFLLLKESQRFLENTWKTSGFPTKAFLVTNA